MTEKEGFAIDYIKCKLRANDKLLIEVSPTVLETILDIIDNQEKEIKKLKNPIICGRTINEVVNILNAFDIEREYDIQVTMENVYAIMDKLQEEINKNMKITMKECVDGACRLSLEYPQFNFKKEDNKDTNE